VTMFIPGVGELTIALDLASAVALGGKWGIDMGEVQAGEGSVKAVVEDTSQALALAAGVKVGTLEHREFSHTVFLCRGGRGRDRTTVRSAELESTTAGGWWSGGDSNP
jgi:hypothetical protein